MSRLSLALLGTPEVRHDRQLVSFPTRKALALLVYLALESGLHSREKLTALFWPESDPLRGRATFRRTLALLREVLDDATAPAGAAHILVGQDALGFNVDTDYDLDVRVLGAIPTLARPQTSVRVSYDEPDPSLLAQLQQAASLYRGDFLEGFSLRDAPGFDEWVSFQRSAWHRRMDSIFDWLSRWQLDRGEIVQALDTATRWLAHDSLSEAAHRRVMRAYIAAGDRAAALRAYEACRALLARELNAEPSPETIALAERIRRDVPEKEAGRQRAAEQPHKPDLVALSPLQLVADLAMVGRGAEFARLVACYHAARRGQAQLVILEGEAGIGKTRLAAEFLAWAAAQGADLLQGRAFESGGRLPYQPLVDALRARLERENAPDDLLADVWLAELSRLLPELHERYPDLVITVPDEAAARARLFEAIARLVQALAQRAPVVLFVDDLQWADVASRDVLRYIARRASQEGTRLLVLLNVRVEALAASADLAGWLIDASRDVPATRLAVAPLTEAEMLELVRGLASDRARSSDRHRAPAPDTDERWGGEAAGNRSWLAVEEFNQWLFAETGGQPFYITETLKALLERGVLAPQPAVGGGWALDFSTVARDLASRRGFLPPGVREVIRARLSRLTPTAFALLVAGAVLGHRFTFELLCQVADLGETEGLPALDEALASRLLRSTTDLKIEATGEELRVDWPTLPDLPSLASDPWSAAEYMFTHDKLRDVVYSEAGDTRRRVFHRRAFDTLQAMGAAAAELAHHAIAARLAAPAFHWSLAAGDDAMRLFAVQTAIAHYEQARRLIDESSATAMREDAQRLYVQLGRAYEISGEPEKAQDAYGALLTFGQVARQPSVESVALNRMATLSAQNFRDPETAMSLLRQARRAAQDSSELVQLAETEWNLAQVSYYAVDVQGAYTYATHALALARELGHQELIARSLNVLAYVEENADKWPDAEAHAEEAHALYVALGDRAMEVDCLCLLAKSCLNDGRPRQAIEMAQAAYAISREIENPWGQVNCALHLTLGFMETGEYRRALEVAQQGVDIARAYSITTILTISLAALGNVERALLQLDAARATHQQALTSSEAMARHPFTATIADELCTDCAMAGAWEEAYVYAQQAQATRENSLYFYTGLTLWCTVEALLRGGQGEQAQEEARRFGERIGNNRRYRIPYLRALAVLAQSHAAFDKALANLEAASALAREIGLPGELWQIQAALSDLYRQRGDVGQAHQLSVQAAASVQSLANRIEDQRLRTAFLTTEYARHVLEAPQ